MMEISFNVDTRQPVLLWQQVKAQIKNYLTVNKVPVGARLPNVKVLAQQANVSLKTAEHALQALIREQVCFRLPKQGTFVGSGYAAPTVRRICALCHSLNYNTVNRDQLLSQVFLGIQKASCNICDTFFLQQPLEESLRYYMEQAGTELCGVIMLHWLDRNAAIQLVRKFPRLRFVFVNYRMVDFDATPENVFGVFNDDFGGAYQLADYLVHNRQRRFGMLSISNAGSLCYDYRLDGFSAGMRSAGLRLDDDQRVVIVPGDTIHQCEDLLQIGRSGAARLLAARHRPELIFAPNDYLAEGVWLELEARGLEQEVEVVGYDGIIAQQLKFTTVGIDFERMGRLAIKLLTAEKSTYFPKSTLVQPQLLLKKHYENHLT